MARLTLSFFGPFQANLEGQPISHFRSTKSQGLLVYLAFNAKKPQPREMLATLLWPEESDQNGRNNLRQSLFQLRKILGDAEGDAQPYLLVTRQTVQFNVDSDFNLDVTDFLKAIEDRDLASATDLYHGELLPGFICDSAEFEDWLRLEREHLHRLALEAMFEVGEVHLQNGRYREAIDKAEQQLKFESWREPAHRQMMQALALSGDRNNALRQYEICREVLDEALGLEPAPETMALYKEILEGCFSAADPVEPLRPPIRERHNLPVDTTPFIGREIELSQVVRLLTEDKQRLVSITGPGGMGKTRLALAAGSEMRPHFSDGVFFVDLASLSAAKDIVPAIASTLGYQAPDKNKDMWPQLLASISRQNILFVLDNFEHLLAGAQLVNDILQSCPQVSILVTTRERLKLASESRFELGGMDYPDSLTPEDAMAFTAVQLFVDSARRSRSDFALTADNVGHVVQVCRLVQGMPLGLVLAAAWLEMLSTAEVAAEVEACVYFLAAELADLPPRQRSVAAVFDRSWQMMAPEEQAVLARLSVFRGGFTREAAEAVADANLRLLLSLVNKSLIRRQPESGRFVIHELLRQFAGMKRGNIDKKEDTYLAHCRFFAKLLAKETARATNMYPIHIATKHKADRENIRLAWSFAISQGLAKELSDMAKGMAVISFSQGIHPRAMLREAIETLKRDETPESDFSLLNIRLVELIVRFEFEDHADTKQAFLTFIKELEAYGNQELLYWGYDGMAFLEIDDDMEQSLQWQEKAYFVALKIEDELFIKRVQALTLWFLIDSGYSNEKELAQLRTYKGQTRSSQLENLSAYFEAKFSNGFIFYTVIMSLCVHHTIEGAYDKAINFGKRGLNIAKEWRDLYWAAFASDRLANIYLKQGLIKEAKAQLLDLLEWHLAIGLVWQRLGYLWSTTSKYPKLLGWETAVAILSMVYHHPEGTVFYRQEIEKARPAVEAEMGAKSFAAVWEESKGIELETAVSLLRAKLG